MKVWIVIRIGTTEILEVFDDPIKATTYIQSFTEIQDCLGILIKDVK